MYYDLEKNEYVEVETNTSLRFLYNTILGRIILKLATTKIIANIYAKYLNSKLSIHKIKKFIKKNNINMNDYIVKKYNSFNEFFIRDIKPNKRKISDGLIAVCDSKLSVYKLDNDTSFNIKGSIYTVEELTHEKRKYQYALIFRLCVDDYHHYVYPDNGTFINTNYINGILHTVQPIALKKYKVFHENSRQVTFLNCEHLKDVCYIEVGAMMVGKIVNEVKEKFNKGEEKGHFEFGGSTIIMLVNNVNIDKTILDNSRKNIETIVKLGQHIGSWR